MDGTDNFTPPTETQVCKCCRRELPISQFGRGGFGLHKTCNECRAQKQREGRKKRDEIADLRRQVEEARQLRLRDFQPRELMIRLRELGYEGVLTYTQRRETTMGRPALGGMPQIPDTAAMMKDVLDSLKNHFWRDQRVEIAKMLLRRGDVDVSQVAELADEIVQKLKIYGD